MKQTLLLTLSSLSMVALMTACTNQMASSEPTTVNNIQECKDIDKKLMKVDQFINRVNNTSAFHLEEEAIAIEAPGITVSNNKKQMLKDANRQRAKLLQEHQKIGCKTTKK